MRLSKPRPLAPTYRDDLILSPAEENEMTPVFLMGQDAWGADHPTETYLDICYQSKKYKSGRWFILRNSNGTPISSTITYAGKKSNFQYRLDTPDRLGEAGIHKMGLGVLIGLEDWRTDSFFTALHLDYLEKKYWQSKYSISFPRLRPFSGGLEPKVAMNDRELVQLICAYRLFNESVELSISTRESISFRNHIIKLGITSISAGSKTNPGGYAVEPQSLEQFEISDERTAPEIAEMIHKQGYEAVWKDWDLSLMK